MTSRISIALCTYNGANFVADFLHSVSTQSLLPIELVVCDDLSNDNTLDIITSWARCNSVPTSITRNATRLGITKNFERAIGLCNGEVIALADQDDVWLPNKLERISEQFSRPDVGLVASDALVVDISLQSMGYTMWDHVNLKKDEQSQIQTSAFDILLKRYVITGAASALRTKLRSHLLPIPENWFHDAWIALIAAAATEVRLIDEPLVLYRQHEKNAVGGRKYPLLEQGLRGLAIGRKEYYKREIGRLQDMLQRLQDLKLDKATRSAEAKLAHLELRAALPKARLLRLKPIMKELMNGNYARYTKDWKSMAIDMFFS